MINILIRSVWRNGSNSKMYILALIQNGAEEGEKKDVKDNFKQSWMFLIVFLFSYWQFEIKTSDVF